MSTKAWTWLMMLTLGLMMATAAGCYGNGSNNGDNGSQDSNLTVSPEKQRQIEALVDETMKSENIPGVVVGIWTGDKEPFILARGVADLKSDRAVAPEDRFYIGSISKTFVATIIYQLSDEGRLNLKDPISRWLPDFPDGSNITVLQLLNMTAGIHDLTGDPAFSEIYYNDPLRKMSRQDEYDIIKNVSAPYHPGERCLYNDANYILLGMIIEKATGNKIEDEIHTRICQPLGLSQTELPLVPEISGQHSKGYREGANGELEEVLVDPSQAWAAGAMVSNLYDLKTYARALYEGKLISAASRKSMQTWHHMDGYPNPFPHKVYSLIDIFYGGGMMNWGGLIGHNGTIQGFNGVMAYIPGKDTTVVIWVNKFNDRPGEKTPVSLIQDKTMYIMYGEEFPFEGLPGI